MMRIILALTMITMLGSANAMAAEDGRATSAATPSSSEASSTAGEGASAGEGGAAMQAGGAGSGATTSGVPTLQDALRECEGLTGALSARCQEQALADHPGGF